MCGSDLAKSIAMQKDDPNLPTEPVTATTAGSGVQASPPATAVREIGGPRGPEPTRFGDWEKAGRCIDF
jgi:hypothetical protein